jgi:hypothetical protein
LFLQAPYFHPRSQRVSSDVNQPEQLGAAYQSINLKKKRLAILDLDEIDVDSLLTQDS